MNGPLSLIAEVTHACPLKCAYCSNPLQLAPRNSEIDTADWQRVLAQAAALGVSQVSFTGGEPCLRPDLPVLVQTAREHGLYVNLITSGLGVNEPRLHRLASDGVDHIQLSFQDTLATAAKDICGVDALAKKILVAEMIRKMAVGFTINLVIHRRNHARLREMIDFAVDLGAQKIEVAHVQFHGWALRNRAHLMPDREQVSQSRKIIHERQTALSGKVRVDYVLPDYHADTPKACMGGWAKKMILINPQGLAAPCHSAEIIPGFERPSVRAHSLSDIWFRSELFNAFRGEEWMNEPCRSCERKLIDFGGCRCQALALTGDARATDPVCRKSSQRRVVDEILHTHEEPVAPLAYRA